MKICNRIYRKFTTKLSTKLFLILLCLTATLLLMAMGLARYSFQQGFLGFVSSMEEARLQNIAQSLVAEYQNNNQQWQWLIEQGLQQVSKPGPRDGRARPSRGGERGRRPPGNEALMHPPPPRHLSDSHRAHNKAPHQNQTFMAVFDHEGKFLSGDEYSKPHEVLSIIELISEGMKIGELRSWSHTEISSELGDKFVQQQFWSSVSIAAFCLMIAGALSWFLAKRLLLPLQQLSHAISTLKSGKYGEKISTHRTDELGELMANVNNLSQTLDKNRTAKKRLFADISHELRTPLTILAGEIELLKAGLRSFNRDNLLSLEQESNLLRHLVDDLYQLSLSDVGGLKYSFVEHDLSEVLTSVVGGFKPRALDEGILITTYIDAGICLDLDEKRIEQLFFNLLTNAITYTDAPGQIKVTLTKQANSVTIFIEDSAPSVSEPDYVKLFEPLYRVDLSRTRRESGAGLGLAISKNIVEAHQGTITASLSPLGGVRMTITLPTVRAAL